MVLELEVPHTPLNSALSSRKSEKSVPFERILDHTHLFINGKVSSYSTLIV